MRKGKAPPGKVECRRCGGEGTIEQFGHIQRGICFECDGTGWGYPRTAKATGPLVARPLVWWEDKKSPSKSVRLLGQPWRIIKGPTAGSVYGRRTVEHDEYAATPEEDWGNEAYAVQFEVVRGHVKLNRSASDALAQKLGVQYDDYGCTVKGSWQQKFTQLERALQALFDAKNRRSNGRRRRR